MSVPQESQLSSFIFTNCVYTVPFNAFERWNQWIGKYPCQICFFFFFFKMLSQSFMSVLSLSLTQRSSFTTIMCKRNRLCWIHRQKTWKPWQRQWPMTEIQLYRLHLNCRKIRECFFSLLHCNNFSSIYIFYVAKPYSWLWLGLSILTQTTEIKSEQQRSDVVSSHSLIIITKYLKFYKSSYCYTIYTLRSPTVFERRQCHCNFLSRRHLFSDSLRNIIHDLSRLWLNQVQVVKIICHFQCFSSYMGPSTTATPSFASLCSLQL